MLYIGEGPCNWSINHNRFWANDNGTTAGRSTATNGSSPPAIATDTGRQLGHRGRLEQGAHRKAGIQAGVDRGDQPHRRQRVPTQVEERVIDPDPLDARAPGRRCRPGSPRWGWPGRGTITVLILRCRQGALVEFAVGGQRQRVDHHHRGRHHVGRQPLGQRAHGSRPGRRSRSHSPPAAYRRDGPRGRSPPPAPPPSSAASAACTSPSSMRYPRILTCSSARPRYRSCPSAPQHTKSPVRYIRCPGAPPRTGTPQTATRSTPPGPHSQPHPGTGHIQLPDHPGRHRTQPPIQHEKRRPATGDPDRADTAPDIRRRRSSRHRGMHRRLGRAIDVDHRRDPGCPPRPPAARPSASPANTTAATPAAPPLRRQRISGLQRIKRRRGLA